MNNLENEKAEEMVLEVEKATVEETSKKNAPDVELEEVSEKRKESLKKVFQTDDEDDDFVEVDGKFMYELKYPIVESGKTIKELTFDFSSINGYALKSAESEVTKLLGVKKAASALRVRETNKDFLCAVAARSCGEKMDTLYNMSGKDFTAITIKVQDFLLN